MTFGPRHRAAYQAELDALRKSGLSKEERVLIGAQGPEIDIAASAAAPARRVVNLCSNDYLGLAAHPDVVAAAHQGLDRRGFGMSSVRFICGTQDAHVELEGKLAAFLGAETALLFPSCLDANAGVLEAILGEADVAIADRLVHASIVDGLRLSKAGTDTYKHGDVAHLEEKLVEHRDKRRRLIVTDGLFSMDGDLAPLDHIVALAERHDAMVLVDDSHATGVLGAGGRGTHAHFDVIDKVDVITTTLGKALGGASGGCVAGRREIVEICRQRARPYLFSNSVAPALVAGALRALEIASSSAGARERLHANATFWRAALTDAGIDVRPGHGPIVPVMLYDAKLAQDFARDLFEEGVHAVGFVFPVVPKGMARIRTQVSAAHESRHLDQALSAFVNVGRRHDVLGKSKADMLAKRPA